MVDRRGSGKLHSCGPVWISSRPTPPTAERRVQSTRPGPKTRGSTPLRLAQLNWERPAGPANSSTRSSPDFEESYRTTQGPHQVPRSTIGTTTEIRVSSAVRTACGPSRGTTFDPLSNAPRSVADHNGKWECQEIGDQVSSRTIRLARISPRLHHLQWQNGCFPLAPG